MHANRPAPLSLRNSHPSSTAYGLTLPGLELTRRVNPSGARLGCGARVGVVEGEGRGTVGVHTNQIQSNQRSSQSHTRACIQIKSNPIKGPHKATHGQGEATSQHCHRGQHTEKGCCSGGRPMNQSNVHRATHYTRARRGHITALPQSVKYMSEPLTACTISALR